MNALNSYKDAPIPELAEVFAMTNPFLSWQMILVGDPLYNPFKTNPAFVIENAPPPPD